MRRQTTPPVLPLDRAELFHFVYCASQRIALPSRASFSVSSAPAYLTFADEPRNALSAAATHLQEALLKLDKVTPLERDPDNGILEVLKVEILPAAARAYVVIQNSLGLREHITTFGHDPHHYANWCDSREDSVPDDSPWCEARAERRVVPYGGDYVLIDRGANLVCDLVEQTGCIVKFSCEGHPGGAYLCYEGANTTAIDDVFRRCGWKVMSARGDSAVYMPPPRTVHERDQCWKDTCQALSLALTPRPALAP